MAEDHCGTCRWFEVIHIPYDQYPDEATGICTVENERIIVTADGWCGDYE